MRVGVPLLLVNLATLLITIVLGTWLSTELFDVRLTPFSATSAVFSLVLGLHFKTLSEIFLPVSRCSSTSLMRSETGSRSRSTTSSGSDKSMRSRGARPFSWASATSTSQCPIDSWVKPEIVNYATKKGPIMRAQPFALPTARHWNMPWKSSAGLEKPFQDPSGARAVFLCF